MPLMLNNGGSSKPYIRYMASTSSWEMSAEGGKQPFQFQKAVIDLGGIKTGWCCFREGQPPEWVMDDSTSNTAPKPEGEGWKRGFKVDVFSEATFGEEPVREWATNSAGGTMSISDLYSKWEQVAEDGKAPVVEFTGATPVKVGKGNTTVPQFNIVKVIDLPDALKSSGATPPSSAPADSLDDEF